MRPAVVLALALVACGGSSAAPPLPSDDVSGVGTGQTATDGGKRGYTATSGQGGGKDAGGKDASPDAGADAGTLSGTGASCVTDTDCPHWPYCRNGQCVEFDCSSDLGTRCLNTDGGVCVTEPVAMGGTVSLCEVRR